MPPRIDALVLRGDVGSPPCRANHSLKQKQPPGEDVNLLLTDEDLSLDRGRPKMLCREEETCCWARLSDGEEDFGESKGGEAALVPEEGESASD